MVDPIAWYEANAEMISARYESVLMESVHGWLVDLLPSPPALILDVGAGSGRDAAWLAGKGYDVVAVEPSPAMRKAAEGRHPDARIRWLGDRLPGLEQTLRLGLSFDFIVLSAVWMHLAPADRLRAFRKLITLLKPGGMLALTLRQRPAEDARGLHPVSAAEIETLARNHGALVVRASDAEDRLGRKEVRWTQLAIRLPDDGTGALPLLRHIILNDDKSSTYKLALLRTLCRIADGAAGYARDAGEEHVAIPLGLAALFWIRLFRPLLAADLPQSPGNRGDTRLGFVKEAFRQLAAV